MTNILKRIADHKKEEVAQARRLRPISALEDMDRMPTRDFISALQTEVSAETKHIKPGIIAEIKKASPSKGVIRDDFNVAEIATIYTEYGARCLSILTDVHFFQGDLDYLTLAKTHSSLPILRKDFILDAYQIHESRAFNADCILLIAALLDDHELHDYCQMAQELGMAVLVESHTRDELERALMLPTPLMGINNRNLQTFVTDLQNTIALSRLVPTDKIVISESGINTRIDIEYMQEHSVHTFLIGESLMQSPDIGRTLLKLIQSDMKLRIYD